MSTIEEEMRGGPVAAAGGRADGRDHRSSLILSQAAVSDGATKISTVAAVTRGYRELGFSERSKSNRGADGRDRHSSLTQVAGSDAGARISTMSDATRGQRRAGYSARSRSDNDSTRLGSGGDPDGRVRRASPIRPSANHSVAEAATVGGGRGPGDRRGRTEWRRSDLGHRRSDSGRETIGDGLPSGQGNGGGFVLQRSDVVGVSSTKVSLDSRDHHILVIRLRPVIQTVGIVELLCP